MKRFCQELYELRCWIELEWTQSLPGNMTMDVPWAVQLIPTGADSSILLVQTARAGLLTETLGLKTSLDIREKIVEFLRAWDGGSVEPIGPVDFAASMAEMPIGESLEEFLAEPGALVQKDEEPVETPVAAASTTPPFVPALVSLFIPGVSQMMNGQVAKGVVILVVAVVLCGLGGLLNLVMAADAYMIGEKKTKGVTVGDWDFF
ncbi:MAG: hypothetical protein GY913_17375 [Proteobacteria bacterium]|nr:hypothetical protein [Pseudomonadota bacterium]MCP4918678.1 hypothetical protein [Pseudomonadota bacterium]